MRFVVAGSLFHMTMALGENITLFALTVIPAFLFLAVWIPCCTSDIVFPLLFSQEALRARQSVPQKQVRNGEEPP